MYPFIDVFGVNISSYGLCMLIGIFLCGFFIISRGGDRGVSFEDMMVILACTLGGIFIGGGLLYIFTAYTPAQILALLKAGEFKVFFQGGLVFYGGLIGGIFGAIISSKILKVKMADLEYCAVPLIPIGHAIGRIGCLLAGCCHGFEYKGPFSVQIASVSYFPVQLLEAVINIAIAFILIKLSKKEIASYFLLICYLAMYGVVRFCLEFLRGDAIRGSFLIFSTSQWISVFILFACVLAGIIYSFSAKNKHR